METKTKYNKPWRFALSMFGLSIMGYMYSAYGTFFYNDKLGLPMVIIGMGNVLFALWDAFNDPIAGYLSDRTRTRWGRRRPWLLSGVVVMSLSSILFFSPPSFLGRGMALGVYFTVFLMLTETSNTIATVNYHSLLPELYRDIEGRSRANSLRQALQLVGMILSVAMVPSIASLLGYQLTALILGVLGGSLVIYSVLGCRERKNFSETPQPKLLDSFKAIAVNRNFWPTAFSHFFYQATTGLLLAGIPFYVKYSLGMADNTATFLSASVLIFAIPSMALWHLLIKRLGTLKVWRIALLWLLLSFVPFFFVRGFIAACIAGALTGIGIAGVTANLDLIDSEIIEDDARRYGIRREATIFAAISFIQRLSGLVRSLAFFLLSALFGFVSGENPGDNAATAARFLTTIFPAILMACSVSVSLLVRFDPPGENSRSG
jgi:GPH family glycoside/pentoside/hexuronide:cation symporter